MAKIYPFMKANACFYPRTINKFFSYYFKYERDIFQAFIGHLISCNQNDCLKYHELELIEVTGSIVKGTKAHVNVIPSDGDTVI